MENAMKKATLESPPSSPSASSPAMEPLRKQLADTQEALTAKQVEYRKLRVDHAAAVKTWEVVQQSLEARIRQLEAELQVKQGLEARIRQLEAELQRLHQLQSHAETNGGRRPASDAQAHRGDGTPISTPPGFPVENKPTTSTNGGGDEIVTYNRGYIQDVDVKFKNVTNELAEKNKLCDELQRQLQQLQAQGGSPRAIAQLDLTDDDVIARWAKLRDTICNLSRERFSMKASTKSVKDNPNRLGEFGQLSVRWENYVSDDQMIRYIIRALIWRYLYASLLTRNFHVWGNELEATVGKVAGHISSNVSDAEYQELRMNIAALFYKAGKPDPTVLGGVTTQILEAITPLASGVETTPLKTTVSDIVAMAAEITTIFARSQFSALMSDKPGSDLTRGFKYKEKIMESYVQLGPEAVVDMMVSPCLLKNNGDYSLLRKAVVICWT
ncbi:hypothetical protein F5B20DRAFT_584816 [Whalleya microplaca]|nr:hypothetical protein F5B20DRAFT_584816 [Whalleya microplaca]